MFRFHDFLQKSRNDNTPSHCKNYYNDNTPRHYKNYCNDTTCHCECNEAIHTQENQNTNSHDLDSIESKNIRHTERSEVSNLDSIESNNFIKLNSYYLVWDADSIPLRDLEFFNENTTLFEMRSEAHIPYFETLARLNIKFSNNNFLAKQCSGSFVAEHIMVDSIKMCELLDMIESSHNTSFFRAIMECIDDKNLSHSGFSEFETYGNFMLMKYPQHCKLIKRKRERYAKELVGGNPSTTQLKWLAKYYDVISIEHFDTESSIAKFTRNLHFMRLFSPRTLRILRKLHAKARKYK